MAANASSIRFDWRRAAPFVDAHEMASMAPAVRAAHNALHEKTGQGRDYLGWVDLPRNHDAAEHTRIKAAAARIRSEADAVVVVGIGGSYTGARATIEALQHSYYNHLPSERRNGPAVYFAGRDLSPVHLAHLLDLLEGREVILNVISKSGTTTEPAIAFRLLRRWMEQRYGRDGARRRIYATTDRSRGALHQLAAEEGYESFAIPDDVGGRYSVLTAVGLLPIAAAGIDTDELLAGATDAQDALSIAELDQNPAYQYAAARNVLYGKGKTVELLGYFEPSLQYTAQWWKQLFGESEGKEHKGLFPVAAAFTTDLHSLGQYVQEGLRMLLETMLTVERPAVDMPIAADTTDLDGLNFLAGQSLHAVNEMAREGTMLAHMDGGVPNLAISLPALTPYHYGQLLYFWQKACGLSGYLLGVNPFDQPGVEAYKQNMFALLGKPGYEERHTELLRRLK